MYCDSHCHLDGFAEPQLSRVLEAAQAAGVEMVVGVGTTLQSSEATLEISRRHPTVIPAVGLHPWWITPLDDQAYSQLRHLAQGGAAALGEIGLDLEREPSTGEIQWQAFRRQVLLARELGLPVLVHCKGAHQEMVSFLKEEGPLSGVLHGFSGDEAQVGDWLDLGFYVSIGLRSFTRYASPDLEKAIRAIPLERLLIETDASANAYASAEANEPAKVLVVAETIAGLRSTTPQEVGRITTANLKAVLGR